MEGHFGTKSANWLAGYRNCQPRFQFHQAKPGRILEPGCDFQTPLEWSDTHERKTLCMSNRRVGVSVKVLKVLVEES